MQSLTATDHFLTRIHLIITCTRGNPDTSETITRIVAKSRAIDRALTADLILHSRTLRGMRSSEHQHNKLLAAHVLSSS
jgi:hypothetical protein